MAMPDAPDMMPLVAPDPEPSPRDRFRRVLHDRAGCTDDVVWYLDQARPTFATDPQVRLAVEELVDHLGRFLQFLPERDEHLGCSIWSSPTAARLAIVVEEPSVGAHETAAVCAAARRYPDLGHHPPGSTGERAVCYLR